jgi:hypothetical protein
MIEPAEGPAKDCDYMSTSPHLTTLNRCFARDYDVGRSAAMRDLERSVLGCDS